MPLWFSLVNLMFLSQPLLGAAAPLRAPWHRSSRGRHFSMQEFFFSCINYVHDVVRKDNFEAILPDFAAQGGFGGSHLEDLWRCVNCCRKAVVIKY